ncbi:MAG: CDP-diacylglycerol--glycerol-3-phosphate 3-phosphatidyltransferase [Bacteroidetes bacterium]|nr:CDP-diacylglycerol--glycerol-3-phosphate 3-phosphatidyltransferase [Bacteroidota bacterium]
MTFPNILSVLRIALSPVFMVLFLKDDPVSRRLSFIVFFVAVLTDWYDGWHARKYKSVTNFGIFIDPLADKVLTSFAFGIFCVLGFMPVWMLVIIVLRDIVVTLIRSYDEYRGKTMKTSFIAKTKTFLQMTYLFFILLLFLLLTYDINPDTKTAINSFIFDSSLNFALLFVITLITLYTGIDYLIRKEYEKRNETAQEEKDS